MKNINRRFRIATAMTALFMLATVLSGCSKEPDVIRLGTMPTYSAGIYAVGIEQGFFEEAGVQVELTVFRSARDRDGAATAGQLDGFMTDIMGAVNLNAKGFPFLITSREYEEFAVVAGPAVDPDSLEVAQTGLGENTIVEYVADTYVDQAIEKVNIVAVPDRMGAVLGGQLDFGVFPQPFIGIIRGQQGQVVASTADKDFHPVVLVFDKTFAEEEDKALSAFYEAYEKTVAYMQQTPYEEYMSALVTHGLATEETVGMYRIPVDRYGLNNVKEEDYKAIVGWMMDKGLLTEEIGFDEIVKAR